LLKPPKHNSQNADKKNIYENARKLEKTFQSFGVKAKVTQVHLGPAVTKYEVYPDVGVKVSKIVNLSDDLALALAAKDIRIEAPIPGKSAVGIEVPNSEIAMVSLREVLDSKSNDRPDAKLLIGLGRDISGDAVLAELNKMPHLLVAGSTGSGKSVCINGIITSILMRAKPHEVKLMMIDPKMVELNVYNGIPHLLAPVVTDPKKASQALKKVVNEMERRYELFSHTGTRNIEGYNEIIRRNNREEMAKQPEIPYIVVIVDELADLMMVASSDVEDSITRLSQMARAAGIHLIIATQRPSVDVITGVIKANIPSRIAFSVSSQTDSRTILDMGGAEKLLGRGDMLFLPVGASKPVRVQGAFLSDEEVEQTVDFVIDQQKAQYQEEMIPTEVVETTSEVQDDLYDDAVQLVADMQTASVSMLQRRFRIGYTRAARLIDAMEERGIVGPYEGSKPREVLLSKERHEELTS
jgi:S-DNA-T family DNA segregation ATPase FtsK/SpoIIIE